METKDYVDNRPHGSSGAHFFFNSELRRAIKMGDYRVGEQGKWLKLFDGFHVPSLPKVYDVRSESYEMELLVDLPRGIVSVSRTMEKMIGLFFNEIWPADQVHIPLNLDVHNLKLARLLGLVRKKQLLSQNLMKLQLQIDWTRLAPVFTHGDPTFDNVMLRGDTGELVIIDPIPATPAVPDLRSVDLGKMLTSAVGFEAVRYEEAAYDLNPDVIANACSNDNEWDATKYWCAVHLLRAIPYMPKEAMKRGLEDLAFYVLCTL